MASETKPRATVFIDGQNLYRCALWPPRGYLTIAQATEQLGMSRSRVHQLIADLEPPDRLDVHPRLTLVSGAAVDRLRQRRSPGRPVGWRKKKPSR